VDRVTAGLRPEWPSNSPPQGLADALWEQIKACWKQEPKERPAASDVLETLLALGETYHHEPVVSVDDLDDEAMVEEWEYVEDGPEEGTFVGLSVTLGLTFRWFTDISAHQERNAHRRDHHNLSGSTLVSSPLPGFKPPHPSGSDVHKSGGRRHRFGKHVRNIFHLPRDATELVGRRGLFEKPKPGVEIIDRCEEKVTVRDDRIPYLVSRPIPEGKTLRKVVITVVSKDQGWSSYPADHGTYRNSWTWFELSVGSSKDSEKWCGEIVRNLHAHDDFKEHTVGTTDGRLYERAKSGDVLTVWALARHPGWKNRVKKVTIRYVVD